MPMDEFMLDRHPKCYQWNQEKNRSYFSQRITRKHNPQPSKVKPDQQEPRRPFSFASHRIGQFNNFGPMSFIQIIWHFLSYKKILAFWISPFYFRSSQHYRLEKKLFLEAI